MMEAKVSDHDKKIEAIRRMQILEIPETIIQQFVEEDKVPLYLNGMREVYFLSRSRVDRITTFETDWNAVVYAVLFVSTSFGDLESYLFVSDDEEEWEMDKLDLTEGYPMTYTVNLSYPELSEFGSISIVRSPNGFITRVS